MNYYLSSNHGSSVFNRALVSTGGTGNVLFSYASQRNADTALSSVVNFDNFKIIIDSGAFSVWNSGQTIDREELLRYYMKIYNYRKDIHFINLDVIPGVRNRKPTTAEAEQACKEGLENYYWFKKRGITTLPVFHEGDNFKYLEIFKNETDYIAISPANDSSRQRRQVWLDKVYANLKADYKTHGLAATAELLMERYPFYSVDSINWMTALMWGHGKFHTDEVTSSLAHDKDMKSYLIKQDIKHYVQLQKYITDVWKKRGIVWD